MQKRFIRIGQPYIDAADKRAVLEVLESRDLALGPKLKEFEKKFAKFHNIKYACAVSSGTAALHCAVKSLGLKADDEVITTPISFIASSNCLLYEGVKPVFVDIEEETYNIDPNKIEAAITKKTKAILVVHIFGQTADMKPIMQIAKKYHLFVIEDACESIGATFKGKLAGTFGDVATFAFYPNKQMTTGEGGMIITKKKRLWTLCMQYRNQGRKLEDPWLQHYRLGYNYRLDEMSTALGISQLKKLEWMIGKRRKIVRWYQKALANNKDIILPKTGQHRTHTWFVYVVRLKQQNRHSVMKILQKNGVETRPYLPAIHLQPFYKKIFGFKKGMLPVAEKIASETLALPLYVGLQKSQVEFISEQVKKALL